MFEALAPVLGLTEGAIYTAMIVFARIAAISALLPGFGEQSVPMRVRLLIALGFTIICWPLVYPKTGNLPTGSMALLMMIGAEVLIGTAMALIIRFLVLALQLAGSMAAQATSLSQIMGAGATPDPMPAIGNILVMGGLALALVADLHIKVIQTIAASYTVLPPGLVPPAEDISYWGLTHAARAFALAFSLAAPFVVASFAYNLMLGFINRAMPQLMVAFIGAPAITAGGILLLAVAGPVILTVWLGHLDAVLADPFARP